MWKQIFQVGRQVINVYVVVVGLLVARYGQEGGQQVNEVRKVKNCSLKEVQTSNGRTMLTQACQLCDRDPMKKSFLPMPKPTSIENSALVGVDSLLSFVA